jgi:hypothetical protein
MAAMEGLAGRRILTVGETTYTWEDLVLYGHLSGDWPALQERAAAGLACVARLEALDDDDPDVPDDDEIDAAAAEFRYARDLVAADEMEAWLARRGLDGDAWHAWVTRAVLLQKWSDDLDAIMGAFPADAGSVQAAMECEALCTGVASSLANRLAGRAAMHARLLADGEGDIPGPDIATLVDGVSPRPIDKGLADVPGPACRARLEHLARLELAWRRFAARHVSPSALQSLVDVHRLDWVRLVVRTVVVADRDRANEIVLCVRDDGSDLAGIAEALGLPVTDARWYLDETDERLRPHLLAARPGDLLGPLPWEEGFLLLAVREKVLPIETDPDIRHRAERALLDRLATREIEDRVTWHESL